MSQNIIEGTTIEKFEPTSVRWMMQSTRWFIHTVGAILAVTGIGKVWSAAGSSKFLAVIDPIIGIKFGHLILVVGVAEIAIALVCFFSKRQTLALGLVAWMSTNFVVYRLGLWWMDWHRPCNCLGNLTDALHISPQTADNIMKIILAYLLIGSYGLLVWRWPKNRTVIAQHSVHFLFALFSSLFFLGCLLLIMALTFYAPTAFAKPIGDDISPFTVEGTISTEVFVREETVKPDITTSVKFLFSYGSNSWQIQNLYEDGITMGVPDAALAGTLVNCKRIPDGIRYFSTKQDREATNTFGSTNKKPLTPAYVEAIPFPPPEMPELFICWLGFCPMPELPVINEREMERLLSRKLVKHPKNRGLYTAKYISPVYFLAELFITNNGTIFLADNSLLTLGHPFENGYTELVYRVLGTTNVSGFAFPASATLTKYVPKGMAKSSHDLRIHTNARLQVTRIQIGSLPLVSNYIPEVMFALDNRFSKPTGSLLVKYSVTNDNWPALTNSRLIQHAAFISSHPPEPDKTSRVKVRTVVLVSLGTLALLPMFFIIRSKSTKQTTKKV